jgi:hypothetical protein
MIWGLKFEFTGLHGFSRRSGEMIDWTGSQKKFSKEALIYSSPFGLNAVGI